MQIDFQKLFTDTFSEIEFNKEKHIYRVKGEEYISTTTLLKEFVPEFDTKEISKKVSKKTGVSQESIIQDWKDKGDNGREIGSALHKHIENEVLNLPYEKPKVQDSNLDLLNKKILQFDKFKKDYLVNKEIVGSEIIIYDEDYKIAGTIDCLIYDLKENIFWFVDWKSNKKISQENKYSNLLPPLQRYENSSFNQYTLQLSVYRYIVEKNIFKNLPNSENILNNSINMIVNFPEDEDTYKIYYTQYFRFSVQQLLNIRKKKIQGS